MEVMEQKVKTVFNNNSLQVSFDILTVLAIGMIAYLIKNLIHEGVGHGGTAILLGGEPIGISSAWWLDSFPEGTAPWREKAVKAGGTIANLLFAGIFYFIWRTRENWQKKHPRLLFFLWLSIVINLLMGGGYMLVDPIGNFGDWSAFLEGVENQLLYRILLVLTGLGVSLLALLWGRHSINVFLGNDPKERKKRTLFMCLGPYVLGGTVFSLSAFLNPFGTFLVITSALSTFGGTAWLVWLAFIVAAPNNAQKHNVLLTSSIPWIILGVASLLFTVFVLGPSIVFNPELFAKILPPQ